MDLSDPTNAALVAAEAAENIGGAYALYGGLLLAAYGEPRETRDVDLAVASLRADPMRSALAELGFPAAPNFEGMVFGGLVVDRITLLGSGDDLGLNTIDLVRPRSSRFAREALERAPDAPLRGRTVRVLSPEDFILFKILSTRDRDLTDAASVIRRSGKDLDRRIIEREVALLSAELSELGIRERYEKLGRRPFQGSD
ncbi:MAG TPA: nucleotidyltransferase [Gemmatimonadota bacterium]|nr:nucleotidyltransferase [Gemmatimonadota bacterium]